MKKYFAATLLLLFVFSVFSQDNLKNKDYYLEKSKKQKTAGWILLGSGAALSISGLIIIGSEASTLDLESDAIKAGEVMNYIGLAAMVGSIPLFIASGRNRRKAAASVAFKMERTTIVGVRDISIRRYPAFAFQIRL